MKIVAPFLLGFTASCAAVSTGTAYLNPVPAPLPPFPAHHLSAGQVFSWCYAVSAEPTGNAFELYGIIAGVFFVCFLAYWLVEAGLDRLSGRRTARAGDDAEAEAARA